MIDPRALFRRHVKQISADHRIGSARLMTRLKRMSPAEFLRQPASVLNHLSLAQYREVVGAIAPDVKLPHPAIEQPSPKKRSFRQWWRERSVLSRSAAMTIVVTFLIAPSGALLPFAYKWTVSRMEIARPVSTVTWPSCSRLSQYTDGCVYTPSQDLNWDWVAQQLDMPVEVLRRSNPHQPPQFMVRRAPLVVWRERGRLEN